MRLPIDVVDDREGVKHHGVGSVPRESQGWNVSRQVLLGRNQHRQGCLSFRGRGDKKIEFQSVCPGNKQICKTVQGFPAEFGNLQLDKPGDHIEPQPAARSVLVPFQRIHRHHGVIPVTHVVQQGRFDVAQEGHGRFGEGCIGEQIKKKRHQVHGGVSGERNKFH